MESNIGIYKAHSTNNNLRSRGGGGVITSILANALETGFIENSLVVVPSSEEPWAKYINATTIDEIYHAAGSKYTLLSFMNMRHLITPRTAVVGLPCQLSTIRNLNCVKIGLFCGISISRRGINYLLKKLRIDKTKIKHFDYRKPGGGLRIEMQSGNIIEYPSYSWLSYFFSYPKCLSCVDNTNHHSDVSVGDRHFQGWSNVITRTKIGERLIDSAVNNNKLIVESITKNDFFSKIQTPYFQKEICGGYQKLSYVKVYKSWIENIPLGILKLFGVLIMRNQARKLINNIEKRVSTDLPL